MRLLSRLVVLAALATAGCTPSVDLRQGLELVDVRTGWYDAGIIDGKNKLVPSVSFRLRNTSSEALPTLQVNALFRRVTETDEWGSAYLKVSGSEGLPAGATSDLIVAHSQLGYTGTEPRLEMLKNAYFVDATVEIFAKYGSQQWTPLAQHPVTRELLPR